MSDPRGVCFNRYELINRTVIELEKMREEVEALEDTARKARGEYNHKFKKTFGICSGEVVRPEEVIGCIIKVIEKINIG